MRTLPSLSSRLTVGLAMGAFLLLAACGSNEDDGNLADPAAAASQALDEAAATATELRPLDEEPPADAPATDVDLTDTELLAQLLDGLTTTTTTLPGQLVTEFILDIDDCFDRIETLVQGRPSVVTTRLPCDEPHGFQIFSRLEYPAPSPSLYPGDDIIDDFALLSCYQRFADWADAEYETSALEIGVFTPDPDDFENESAPYRGIHCWVYRLDSEPLVGTARSSGI